MVHFNQKHLQHYRPSVSHKKKFGILQKIEEIKNPFLLISLFLWSAFRLESVLELASAFGAFWPSFCAWYAA
jgi:hypothetical protein